MEVVRLVGLVAGIALVGATYISVVHRLIVPRGTQSWVAGSLSRVLMGTFHRIVRGRAYRAQDRILTMLAPVAIISLLLVWLSMFLLGFALILWHMNAGSFGDALRGSGSALFTLGFVEAGRASPVAVHFVAAFTGLLILALQIAYLPVLYAAFNRRETLVSMLDTRAGVPAWGPELLGRHALVNIVDNLPRFYGDWEAWMADVAESHTNYPTLLYFRSPQANRNWLIALLSVLDSAALYLACAPSRAPSEARLCLRMGFTGLRDIARTVRIPFDPDPLPTAEISLPRAEFDRGLARLRQTGFPVEVPDDEVWAHFRGWRVNYESIAYALADRIDAVRAPWSGPRSVIAGEEVAPYRPPDRRPDDPDAAREGARPNDPRRS